MMRRIDVLELEFVLFFAWCIMGQLRVFKIKVDHWDAEVILKWGTLYLLVKIACEF